MVYHYFSIHSILGVCSSTPSYGFSFWFLRNSQPFMTWIIWIRVELFWEDAISWASLTCHSHTFFWIPWALMSSSIDPLNIVLYSGGRSEPSLFYSWSLLGFSSHGYFSESPPFLVIEYRLVYRTRVLYEYTMFRIGIDSISWNVHRTWKLSIQMKTMLFWTKTLLKEEKL